MCVKTCLYEDWKRFTFIVIKEGGASDQLKKTTKPSKEEKKLLKGNALVNKSFKNQVALIFQTLKKGIREMK